MRRRASVLLALAAAVLAPPAAEDAHASCAPNRPVDQLRKAEGAFIGTALERTGDVITYEVDEVIKGTFGARVQVRDEYPNSSVQLNPPPGDRGGLFLRRAADGTFVANACTTTTPEIMRRAAVRQDRPCRGPNVSVARTTRRGRRVTLTLRLRVPEGRAQTLHVRWGDGSPPTQRMKPKTTLRLTHRYAKPGRFRIRASLYARVPPECGNGWTSPERSVQVRIR